MGQELLVEIDFDAPVGTKRYSLMGFSRASAFYEPRVVSYGGLERDISVVPSEFRSGEISVDLDNSDNYFSDLKSQTPFKNRLMKYILGDPEEGDADFTTVGSGKIQSFGGRNIFTITARDETLARFDQPACTLSQVITPLLFPDLPDDTPLNLVAYILGTVSSAGLSNTGALPAYRIDPAVSQANYRYVAAIGTVTVDNVYIYGVLDVSSPIGYTVSQVTYGARTFTVIDFSSDPKEADRNNELEITWDGSEATTNPADQWEQILTDSCYDAAELDSDAFDAAATILNVRQISSGFALIDKDETLRGIAEKFAESCNMTTYVTRAGKVAVTVPQPGAAAAAGLTTIDETQIVRDSFSFSGIDEFASDVEYEFSRNWWAGEFDERLSFHDTRQQVRLGETITVQLELWYIRNASSAVSAINDRMFFMAEERAVVEMMVDADLIKTISIGQNIRITHFAGLGESGYSSQLFRVIGTGIAVEDAALMGVLRCVDMTETPAEVSKDFKRVIPKAPLLVSDYRHNVKTSNPIPSLVDPSPVGI